MTPRALFLHGGPGLNDYLGSLEAELEGVFVIERYEQGKHRDVPAFVAEAVGRLAEPAWLVGHSWGGRLAFEIAAAAPERVLGVVAVGSLGALGLGYWDETGPRMLERLTDEERALLDEVRPDERLRIVWPSYFSSREAMQPFPEDLRSEPDVIEAIHGWITERADDSAVADGLHRFERPVLIVHGALDAIPLAAVEETAAVLPGGQLVVLDGVAHFPWLEQPGSVREVVVDFLDRHSSY
jgi:proline iminopeptidase